jgi:sulfatase maturation enzyme AslB (radical SAM superfamily)
MVKGDVSRKTHEEAMMELLKKNPEVEEIIWTGGEPLLAYKKLVESVEMMREERPSATHYLFTNGRKLRLEQVDFLKTFHRVVVSIDGYDNMERSLLDFARSGDNEAFEVMAQLDNVICWSVLTRERIGNMRWHEDMLKMQDAIHHLGFIGMNYLFDNQMTKILSPDHVLNFIYGFDLLRDNMRKLNRMNKRETIIKLEKFFDADVCNACSEIIVSQPNGDVQIPENVPIVVDRGCNKIANAIGAPAYEYIMNWMNPIKIKGR